jgi:ketopantoate reductase
VDQCRPTEIKAINGFVVREAQSMGIEAPVNQVLTTLVETMEAHYRE